MEKPHTPKTVWSKIQLINKVDPYDHAPVVFTTQADLRRIVPTGRRFLDTDRAMKAFYEGQEHGDYHGKVEHNIAVTDEEK